MRAPTTTELAELTHTIAERVGHFLQRQGLLGCDGEQSFVAGEAVDEGSMDPLSAHSMMCSKARMPRSAGTPKSRRLPRCRAAPGRAARYYPANPAGQRGAVRRPGGPGGRLSFGTSLYLTPAGQPSAVQIGNPADLSLHAGIAAKVHQRQKLERVCRYIALDGRRVDGTGPGRLAGGDEPDPRLHGAQPGALHHRPGADLDPVLETAERDLQVLKDMGLTLMATLETHVHADHLTSARRLKQRTECQIACPRMLDLPCADIGLQEGEPFRVGSVTLHPLFTPGHTDHHHAYLIDTPVQKLLFTGDALLIEACGRTDFQSGSATDLYNSIHNKLFSLPGETLVYPGHDYEQRFVSSIAQEKARNPRLGGGRSKEDFVALMDGLDLPYPRKIDFAVPGNEDCGQCPANIPEQLRGPCAASDQG